MHQRFFVPSFCGKIGRKNILYRDIYASPPSEYMSHCSHYQCYSVIERNIAWVVFTAITFWILTLQVFFVQLDKTFYSKTPSGSLYVVPSVLGQQLSPPPKKKNSNRRKTTSPHHFRRSGLMLNVVPLLFFWPYMHGWVISGILLQASSSYIIYSGLLLLFLLYCRRQQRNAQWRCSRQVPQVMPYKNWTWSENYRPTATTTLFRFLALRKMFVSQLGCLTSESGLLACLAAVILSAVKELKKTY